MTASLFVFGAWIALICSMAASFPGPLPNQPFNTWARVACAALGVVAMAAAIILQHKGI